MCQENLSFIKIGQECWECNNKVRYLAAIFIDLIAYKEKWNQKRGGVRVVCKEESFLHILPTLVDL